jgi:hypothetical protein
MDFSTLFSPSARREPLSRASHPLASAHATAWWRVGAHGRARQHFFALMAVCVLAFTLASTGSAHAEGVNIKAVKIDATEEGHQVNADFDIVLAPALLEAARKGVPLYFIIEVELTRDRWYWLDDVVVRATRDRRVSYLPLTEQYRLTTSGVSQQVNSVDDVRRALSRVRSWTIAEKGKLRNGERYNAAIRFRLDSTQLPKPFQLNTIGSKEWNLSSEWYRWSFVVGKDDK